MVTYADLNQRNPGFRPERHRLLCALYEGGEKLEQQYSALLPQRERERQQRYQLRLKEAQYRNYLGPIIDYFRSMLFVSRPILKAKKDGAEEATTDAGDYWSALREDCDGGGTDIDAFYGQILTDAMVGRTGWIRLHLPEDGGVEPGDAAEFEKRKLGDAWLERLEACDVLDWDDDGAGRLAWAITHKREQRRRGISDIRKRVVETWDYLTPESIETYRIEYDSDNPPKGEDEVQRMGPPRRNRFGAVPLVCLDLPPALWVANRLQSAQLAHFRKLNAQAWSLAATCYAVREYFVKDPDEFQKQVSGPGYEVVLFQEDKAQWSAPPGEHFNALDVEIKAEKDEIFRVAHQMALGVENNAAAVGRSADSKASDAEVTRVTLTAFSRVVKETIEYTLDLIATARGEKLDWSVEGLDDFAAFDLGAFLTQLTLLEKAGGVMSRTFSVQKQIRVAESLLKDVDEETKAQIRKEIEAGTTDPAEDAKLERDAAAALFAGGPAAPPNGARRPGAAAPPSEA
jgi:hypothetical protein